MLRTDILVIISRQRRAFDHSPQINILINLTNHEIEQLTLEPTPLYPSMDINIEILKNQGTKSYSTRKFSSIL